MIETGVVISAGASKDIAALATGQDRVVVALTALKEAKDNGTLTPDQKLALDALAGKAEKLRPESQTAGREITLNDGAHAIEMQVPVNGQIIRAVLSDSPFNRRRNNQGAYAEGLGGRLATREENRAVVNDLLEKEEKKTLNPAEQKLLTTYREKYVRDSEGVLDVDGRRVRVDCGLGDGGPPGSGALVVLPLAELLSPFLFAPSPYGEGRFFTFGEDF